MSKQSKKKLKKYWDKAATNGVQKMPPLLYGPFRNPFVGLSRSDISDALRQKATEDVALFDELFPRLQQIVDETDPLYILSCVSYYYLIFSEYGAGDRELTMQEPIFQAHVELLQALALRSREHNSRRRVGTPDQVEDVTDLVRQTLNLFSSRRFAVMNDDLSEEETRRLALVEDMHIGTQAVRNWGYPDQLARIVKIIFQPLDARIEQLLGVRVEHLTDMFMLIVSKIEDRINDYRQQFIPMMAATTIEGVVKRYHESFPDLKGHPSEMIAMAKQHKIEVKQLQIMLIAHGDLRLSNVFTLTLQDFVDAYPTSVDVSSIQTVLEYLSLSFGDTASLNPEHFFLNNPVWKQPLVRLNTGEYFFAIPNIFLSFCVEQMEHLISRFPELVKMYQQRRGEVLEDEVARQFRKAFPEAQLLRGTVWHDKVANKDYENDLIVLVDSCMFVIEEKAGRVPDSARRGGEERIKRAVEDLMLDASEQGLRFVEYLKTNPGQHRLPNKRGGFNKFDTADVHTLIRLNITLEHVGLTGFNAPNLRAAGLIPENHELAPTLCLSDLESVLELLDGPCQKIHYFARRSDLESHATYLGDEMDLLAFYMETGFNIGPDEYDGTLLHMLSTSKALDPYFMSKDISGSNVDKPRLKMTRWWREIFDRIEKLKPPRYTEMGTVLLNFDVQAQQDFEKRFRRNEKNVRANLGDSTVENAVIVGSGPPQRQSLVFGLAYGGIPLTKRNEMMEEVAAEAFGMATSGKAVVIGIDVVKHDPRLPYSMLGCYFREGSVNKSVFDS